MYTLIIIRCCDTELKCLIRSLSSSYSQVKAIKAAHGPKTRSDLILWRNAVDFFQVSFSSIRRLFLLLIDSFRKRSFILVVSLLSNEAFGTDYRRECAETLQSSEELVGSEGHNNKSDLKSIRNKSRLVERLRETPSKSPSKTRRRQGEPSQTRNGRTTYVKAILSNPKVSSEWHLAEKLAEAELKSPKMQEAFKKLTVVQTPDKNARGALSDSSQINWSSFHDEKIPTNSIKLARNQRVKSRKKTKHKNQRRERRTHLDDQKEKRLRPRSIRQSFEPRSINSANFRGKSIESREHYRPEILKRDQLVEAYPDENAMPVNYPDNFNSNYDNSGNSVNYSPLGSRKENVVNPYFSNDNFQNYRISNGQSPANLMANSIDVSYLKNKNEIPREISHYNTQNRQNPLSDREMDIRYRYMQPDEQNVQRIPFAPGYKNLQNQRSNRFVSASNIFRNDGSDFPRDSFAYSKYRSEPVNSLKTRRFLDGNKNSVNPLNNSAFAFAANTFNEPSKMNETEDLKQPAMKTSSLLKSQDSEKSISKMEENCTTTEMNPKLEGIGEASVLPKVAMQKAVQASKTPKEMEFPLSNTNTKENAGATLGQSSRNQQDYNTGISNQTEQVAGQILNKIIEELEDFKVDKGPTARKEDLPCRLSGSWITSQAGVRIDMRVTKRGVNVSMSKLSLPSGIAHQTFLNYTWNITGHTPFKRGGPFSLIAVDNHTKSLAVFVGACRVCQGIDTIEGVWSIAREPRDCRDFQVATSIYNDIFRRTNLPSAIKERQMEITRTTNCTSTSVAPLHEETSSSSSIDGVEFP